MHTKRLTHALLLFVVLAVFLPLSIHLTARPAHAADTTYYIDHDQGNGQSPNPGPPPNCPWQTVAPVNTTTFGSGDIITFKDGDTWTDTGTNPYYLHPLGSGT
ncbi:MAG: hypothetical protein ACYDER_14380, partial [Ktedonobacteraceae bacterium]